MENLQHPMHRSYNSLSKISTEDSYQKNIIKYSSAERTLLRSKVSLLRRFSTFFGMEPEEKVLRLSPFIAKAVLIASIGGILFGYDLGVVSNALPSLSQSFNLSQSQQENVVGVLYLGSTMGSAFGGFLCDYLGRKSGILFTDVVFMVGAMLLAFANSVPTLIIDLPQSY